MAFKTLNLCLITDCTVATVKDYDYLDKLEVNERYLKISIHPFWL